MSNKIRRSVIAISFSLNIIFLLSATIMFYKNWSFLDVKNKIIIVFSQQKPSVSSYYLAKTDQFKVLKKSSNDIIFLGDSITDMGEWMEIFNNHNIKNRGINSDNIKGILNRIDDITEGKPKSVFLMIGTNDLSGNPDIPDLVKEYDKIIKTLKGKCPDTKIYIQSVLPINSSTWENVSDTALNNKKNYNKSIKLFNSKIEYLAKKEGVQYINLFDIFSDNNGELNMNFSVDGIHLNGSGYMLWKNNIKNFIN